MAGGAAVGGAGEEQGNVGRMAKLRHRQTLTQDQDLVSGQNLADHSSALHLMTLQHTERKLYNYEEYGLEHS